MRKLVAQHGVRRWALIAAALGTKTQKQVYARWRDYLQPSLVSSPWSGEEHDQMIRLQAKLGNQWALLAKHLPGRSPNAIKNRCADPPRNTPSLSLSAS